MRLETIAGGAEAHIAHEGAMGVVREGPELEMRLVETPSDPYVGLGQVQDIVDELLGVPGRFCQSTLDSAMRTLRITDAAEQQMGLR